MQCLIDATSKQIDALYELTPEEMPLVEGDV